MEQPPAKALSVAALFLESFLHHHIAAEHHFTHRFAVGRRGRHRVGVHDVERLERMVANALAGFQMRLYLASSAFHSSFQSLTTAGP